MLQGETYWVIISKKVIEPKPCMALVHEIAKFKQVSEPCKILLHLSIKTIE